MKMILRLLIVMLSLGLTALPASAWGKTGHRVTGAIATPYLSFEAQTAIADILGVEDLAEASTWPDFMRSNSTEYWRRTANPWHYVTVPEGETYTLDAAPEWGDAYTALNEFNATLRDPTASQEDKALALRFAIHIIGDLHQPLHAGNGLDRGGNTYTVTFFDKMTNLHAVWDSDLIDHEELSYTELSDWLARTISAEDYQSWADTDPATWITESAAIRDTIYPEDRDLRWGYVYDHRATYRTRLKQAGIRMAVYLNEVFADPE
jgi:nuclease S1